MNAPPPMPEDCGSTRLSTSCIVDRRIDRVAALLEHAQACVHCQRIRRHDHVAPGFDRALRRPAGRTLRRGVLRVNYRAGKHARRRDYYE